MTDRARMLRVLKDSWIRRAGVVLLAPLLCACISRAAGEPAEVVIRIEGVRGTNGQVKVALFGREGFPLDEKRAVRSARACIPRIGTLLFRLDDVPYGLYAAVAYHDENGNDRLDRNLTGRPVEGYAVSNGVRTRRRPPRYDDAQIPVDRPRVEVTLRIEY